MRISHKVAPRMERYRVKRGLRLPMQGAPEQNIYDTNPIRRVAILADDYVSLKPRLLVAPGDLVRRGQLIIEDRARPWVRITAPAAGEVHAIHRGARRRLRSVVLNVADAEQQVAFSAYQEKAVGVLEPTEIKELLLESGVWTALRTRPFGKIPDCHGPAPHSIFVTAMDSNPLAASLDVVLAKRTEDFFCGLEVLTKLTPGTTHLCKEAGSKLSAGPSSAKVVEFSGPHPAGTVGMHMHVLDPVGRAKTNWYIDAQDVAAIGVLFRTGKLSCERVIALAGPATRKPRLLRARLGAFVPDLVRNEIVGERTRVVAGSALYGRRVQDEQTAYLGRYQQQITVLPEVADREFLGWLAPGLKRFSVLPIFASRLFRRKPVEMTSTMHGSTRANYPLGTYERIMPMDMQPTFLLRALLAGDLERAEQLGCLELEEEDLALCTFVCPGKNDYGPLLRAALDAIAKEMQ